MLPTAARAPSEPPRPRAAASADRHLADLGWRLEVEGEADMWGPHVSNRRDLFFPNMVICIKIRPDVWAWMVGRCRKWQKSGRRRIAMANFRMDEL
jgi:hypothetical protein